MILEGSNGHWLRSNWNSMGLSESLPWSSRSATSKNSRRVFRSLVNSLTSQGVAAWYAMTNVLRFEYVVPLLCWTLSVATSGYYAWQKRPTSPRQKTETWLVIEINADYKRNRETDGSKRHQSDFAEHGIHPCWGAPYQVNQQEHDIICKKMNKFKATTNFNNAMPIAEKCSRTEFWNRDT